MPSRRSARRRKPVSQCRSYPLRDCDHCCLHIARRSKWRWQGSTWRNRSFRSDLTIGAPEETSLTMPELSASRLRPLLLAHRPEIKMAVARIDMEKSKLQLARREWIPDPALTVKAQRYNDA